MKEQTKATILFIVGVIVFVPLLRIAQMVVPPEVFDFLTWAILFVFLWYICMESYAIWKELSKKEGE